MKLLFKSLAKKVKTVNKVKLIFLVYTLIILFSSLILFFPFTHKKNNLNISYTNSLFLAASAFSDTGLTVISLEENWNEFGQAIVAILILVGGFGFFAIKIYIFNFLLNRKSTTFSSTIVMTERGGISVGSTKKIITVSLTVLFLAVIFSSFLLTFIFYLSKEQIFEKTGKLVKSTDNNFWKSVKFGIFHAISAINNAGFDIIGENSIQGYYNNYLLQIIFIFLFFIGGVGYPVIYDIHQKN